MASSYISGVYDFSIVRYTVMGSSGENQYLDATVHNESTHYTVSCSLGKKKADLSKKDELNKKKFPVNYSGNNPGRVKRVVSSKRKTRHLRVARKKPSGSGKAPDAANKESKVLQEMFDIDHQESTANVNSHHNTGTTGFEDADSMKLTELTRDHSTVSEVLLGRNLRLQVALTLWQRHFGEMLTYFFRIQDTGVFVDILPLITKSMEEDSSSITIGCCVDLFPLVQNVLISPYEEYVLVALTWINSVLKRWWEKLKGSGFTGSTELPLDRNFQVFNQRLLDLWHQEPQLKFLLGAAGEMAKAVESFMSQLT
ncbi:KATNB1-like protein 1 isoform X1 [Nerophis ophidion]|uniref:KATNB1-like protein 1 isoform X1 n=2 Tax=Nerophis ophidion TaxID=159077 RepID=UPI002AE0253E|nr:KATNB1-like protein 1 isoform X1 [Nerophis ophidion]